MWSTGALTAVRELVWRYFNSPLAVLFHFKVHSLWNAFINQVYEIQKKVYIHMHYILVTTVAELLALWALDAEVRFLLEVY